MKKYQFFFLSLILGLCSLMACQEQEKKDQMLLNVPVVINKTTTQNIELMGKPDTIVEAGGSRGTATVHKYKKNGIEMYYFNDVAKEIIIRDPKPVPFDVNYIKYLGIKPTEGPDYAVDSVVISWGNIPGYNQVSMLTQTIDSTLWDYIILVEAK